VALAALAIAYVVVGARYFISFDEGMDAHFRWQEVSYVARGVDPYLVLRGLHPVDEAIGAVRYVYPPWSYFFGFFLVPPVPFRWAMAWFGLVNFAAIAAIAAWAWSSARRFGPWAGGFVAAAMLSSLSVAVGLRHGQYSIVVCALLLGLIHLEERERPVLAGACLGLAMIKPQIALLFFFIPLVRRSWVTLVTAAGLVGVGWLIASALVGRSPSILLFTLLKEGTHYEDAYLGILHFLVAAGVSRPWVTGMGAVLGLVATAALSFRYRSQPPLLQGAVCAVIATLWGYHRTADVLVIGLLVVALCLVALRDGDSRSWTAVATVGASYWIPHMNVFYTMPFVPEFYRILWIAGLAFALHRHALIGAPVRSSPAPARPFAS
jgi:hypothetical protein